MSNEKIKIEIYSHEDDGYQIIYINGVFYTAIHFNDSQLHNETIYLLAHIGCQVISSWHDDIPEEYKEYLLKEGFIND